MPQAPYRGELVEGRFSVGFQYIRLDLARYLGLSGVIFKRVPYLALLKKARVMPAESLFGGRYRVVPYETCFVS